MDELRLLLEGAGQLIFATAQYTKNCTLEPGLGGQQGLGVTKAFNGVIYG